jgi:hypothetical protein
MGVKVGINGFGEYISLARLGLPFKPSWCCIHNAGVLGAPYLRSTSPSLFTKPCLYHGHFEDRLLTFDRPNWSNCHAVSHFVEFARQKRLQAINRVTDADQARNAVEHGDIDVVAINECVPQSLSSQSES